MPGAEQADFRLKGFYEAVMADAKEERDSMIAEMEAKRAAGIEKLRKEIADRTEYTVSSETARMRNEWKQKTAHNAMKYRDTLLHIREEIEKEVFSRVEERMRAFIVSGDYESYFLALLKRHEHVFYGRSFIFEVGAADMRLKEAVLSFCPGSEVRENPGLLLGGFIATERGGALRIVETTESRLAGLREHFSERADLII